MLVTNMEQADINDAIKIAEFLDSAYAVLSEINC